MDYRKTTFLVLRKIVQDSNISAREYENGDFRQIIPKYHNNNSRSMIQTFAMLILSEKFQYIPIEKKQHISKFIPPSIFSSNYSQIKCSKKYLICLNIKKISFEWLRQQEYLKSQKTTI